MKKFTLLFMSACFMLSIHSQTSTWELSFTAENCSQCVSLDSIFIENLTQGGDTTLYAPDTILELDIITSIKDNILRKSSFFISQNYPNPFTGRTSIDVVVPLQEKIKIQINDLLGRDLGYYEYILGKGIHTFTFYAGSENYYLLTITGNGESKTVKMVSINERSLIASDCKLTYTAYDKTVSFHKALKRTNTFGFMPGDELRFIGYANTVELVYGSDVIEDAPASSESYIFSIIEGVPCNGLPCLTYAFKLYATVQIGDQCWLKENLNIGTMITGSQNQTDNNIIEKYCYDNIAANCDTYGGLYQWDEMMKYTTQNGTQGICPDGWHIPTDEEWKILEGTVDSQYPVGDPEWDKVMFRGFDACINLKSISGWGSGGNGTNLYGFTALPGGNRGGAGDGGFYGGNGCLWSSTEYYAVNRPWWRWVTVSEGGVYRGYSLKDYGFSVRCLKDD